MIRASNTRRNALAIGALLGGVLACSMPGSGPTAAPIAPSQPQAATSESTAGALTGSPTLPATQAATATMTATSGPPAVVTISAVGGRLNVRRGPGAEYDTVGSFRETQSSLATARNADGSWVRINTPNTSKALGWITLKTKYTSVKGDVQALPLLTMDPAIPAFVRNCTPHEMQLDPAGAVLLDRSATPENQQQIFPGEYSVFDLTTETALGGITVFEGQTIDIKQDSSGKNFVCP